MTGRDHRREIEKRGARQGCNTFSSRSSEEENRSSSPKEKGSAQVKEGKQLLLCGWRRTRRSDSLQARWRYLTLRAAGEAGGGGGGGGGAPGAGEAGGGSFQQFHALVWIQVSAFLRLQLEGTSRAFLLLLHLFCLGRLDRSESFFLQCAEESA